MSWSILYACLEAIYYGLLITMGLIMHSGGRESNVGVLLQIKTGASCRSERLAKYNQVPNLNSPVAMP